jgi:hypothetical protein
MELWAVAAAVTTTTIATTTRAATTTLQTSTTLGATPGDGGGSELRAALIGALVGGLASGLAALGGSVVVERMKLRKTVLIRMYEELLPVVEDDIAEHKRNKGVERELPGFRATPVHRHIEPLERISVMAGRKARRLVTRIDRNVHEYNRLAHDGLYTDQTETGSRLRWRGDRKRVRALFEEIDRDLANLTAYLRKKVD